MPAKTLTLELPIEFIRLCRLDKVAPEAVLLGFIADLCNIDDAERGYVRHASAGRDIARFYYEQVGHPWLHKP